MSSKRDEMALDMLKKFPNASYPPFDTFKNGWDAALLHDERVLALVECLERNEIQGNGFTNMDIKRTLTQYRESVKK